MKADSYKKILSGLLIAVIAAGICFISFKYLLPVLFPFIAAWLIACILQPIIAFLNKHVKLPKKLSVLILVLLTVFILGFCVYLIIMQVYEEIQTLYQNISLFISSLSTDSDKIDEIIDKIDSMIPFMDLSDKLYELWENIDDVILNMLTGFSQNLSSGLIPFLSRILVVIPNTLFSVIIVIISAYYFAIDFKKINAFVLAQLPEKAAKGARIIKKEFFSTTGSYIRAYSLIVLITFTQLFISFVILDIKYAFVIAAITALVDILPVLGTGTVMVPWAIYCFISGDSYTGIGLVISYIIITIIRQIIEPKIVGTYIGLYPLAALICMYSGLKLMGLFGLFLFPIVVIILKNLNDAGHIKLWKIPEECAEEKDEDKKRRKTVKFKDKTNK